MIYASEKRDIRMLAVGDTMPTRRLTVYDEPQYLALVELMRSADASIANLETTVRRPDEGHPNISTGTIMSTPPELLADLAWMGINLVSSSNNHATDYGVGGILASIDHLRKAGLAFAGIGATLTAARAPCYLETAKGRIGLVSATSFFAAHARAGDSRPDAPGRPGINPLRFSKIHTVDDEAFRDVARIKEALGLSLAQKRNAAHFYSRSEAPLDLEDEQVFLEGRFRRGDGFAVSTEVHRGDAEANLRQIREARRRADWVVFAFHNHEMGAAGQESAKSKADLEEPAGFALDFARAAIEAGADMVVFHGPHVPLGVEVHRGRPILHSLGNFVLQNDTVASYPADAYDRFGLPIDATPADFIDERSGHGTRGFDASLRYWLSIVADAEFRAGRLTGLKLHPVDLGHTAARSERGRPVLARGDAARIVLERVRDLSMRFGTEIVVRDDHALVVLD